MERIVHCMEESFDIYIGRPHPRFPQGSKWANPFKITGECDREEVIRQFEAWLPKQNKLMQALSELEGKVLGCWCKSKTDPKPCHGDVLLKFLEIRRRNISQTPENRIPFKKEHDKTRSGEKREIHIPLNLSMVDTIRLMRENGVDFNFHQGRLSYTVPDDLNASVFERFISSNHAQIAALIGGCSQCGAYCQTPAGNACYYDAYFLGKSAKPQIIQNGSVGCRLNSVPIR